jgi:hypothetical protein
MAKQYIIKHFKTALIITLVFLLCSSLTVFAKIEDPIPALPAEPVTTVVINEIDIGDVDKLELYNYGSSAANLTNWTIKARQGTSTTTFVIPVFTLPAYGYVILDEGTGINTSNHLYFSSNITWSNGIKGAAELYDSSNNPIDFVRWGDDTTPIPVGTYWYGTNPPAVPSIGSLGLGRRPNGVDTDYGSDFCLMNLSMGGYNKGCINRPADFDGDQATDISVFRPSNGYWYADGQSAVWWGIATDRPVPGDYDKDGVTNKAIFRPSNGYWYVKTGCGYTTTWWDGDIPVPGDYDGDGDTDLAVIDTTTGYWHIRDQGSYAFYGAGDIPVPCDYDGDGDTDIAVFRPSNGYWYVRGGATTWWGTATDVPLPGDYDGDGVCDIAMWRPSNGYWYIRDGASYSATWWGIATDIPVPGDYDGDGDTDFAVVRPSSNTWYVRDPAITQVYYAAGDFPLPARDTNGDGDPWQ